MLMKGFQNWLALEKIFGSDFDFQGQEIKNILVYPLGNEIRIVWVVGCPVLNPPKKWKAYEKVCITIDYFFVKEIHTNMRSKIDPEHRRFIVRSFSMNENQDNAFHVTMESELGDTIAFEFEAAYIQWLKPMVFDAQYNDYIVAE